VLSGKQITMNILSLRDELIRCKQLGKQTACKLASFQVAGYYAVSGNSKYVKYAERILNCSPRLEYVMPRPEVREPVGWHTSLDGDVVPVYPEFFPSPTRLELQDVYRCHVRLCPNCQKARTDKIRSKLFESFPQMVKDYPNHQFLLLTLTTKNCPIRDLNATIASQYAAWNRMTQRKTWPAVGYLKSLEVTMPWDCHYDGVYLGRMGKRSLDKWIASKQDFRSGLLKTEPTDEAHPHIHGLLMVPGSYFIDKRKYLSQEQWTELWWETARLDYKPMVDVRKVKNISSDTSVGVLEVAKYTTKPEDLAASPEWLYALTEQMHKVRAVSSGGLIADYISQTVLDRIATSIESGDEERRVGQPVVFVWSDYKQMYSCRQIGTLSWTEDNAIFSA